MVSGEAVSTFVAKEQLLRSLIRGYGRVAIGFSGGVDSTLLLRLTLEELGCDKVLAVIADTPSLPRREYAEAVRLAKSMGVTWFAVQPEELADPVYAANPPDRCYICKRHLFAQILVLAKSRGFTQVLDGSNADDVADYRPGQRALRELGVKSPLMEAGLTKEEIRLLSKRLWLLTAKKPAMACLASRVPYGTLITREILNRIERAEEALLALGFKVFRVRHHGAVARIEIGSSEISRLLNEGMRAAVVHEIRATGYHYVALDLQGYRTGSLNEMINAPDVL